MAASKNANQKKARSSVWSVFGLSVQGYCGNTADSLEEDRLPL